MTGQLVVQSFIGRSVWVLQNFSEGTQNFDGAFSLKWAPSFNYCFLVWLCVVCYVMQPGEATVRNWDTGGTLVSSGQQDKPAGIEIIVTKDDIIQQFPQFMSQYSVASDA